MEVFRDQLANGLVRGAIDRRGLDFDFEAPVGLRRYAFALATRMYLDVYSHVGAAR